ncbi:MAG: GNAT family N-acetyltransferase [Planctomycetales bacterium]
MQPMSPVLLEYFIFSKPYFFYDGLIVACDGDQPIGFVHGGFGPTPDRAGLDLEVGTVCFIVVRPEYRRRGIGKELLGLCEGYFLEAGCKTLYGGSARPIDPFYLGIYGGSEMPGVLTSLPEVGPFLLAHGYEEETRRLVVECELASFQAPVDRRQAEHRRNLTVELVYDPPPSDWWDACTLSNFERVRFELFDSATREVLGKVNLWMLDPLAHSWGVRAVGMTDLEINEPHRRQGLGSYLVSEALRRLYEQGIWLVQAQADVLNEAAMGLFNKLGFSEVDQGVRYIKHPEG